MNIKKYLLDEKKIPKEISLGTDVFVADYIEKDINLIHMVYRIKGNWDESKMQRMQENKGNAYRIDMQKVL